jgi:hypothetical protein
MAIPPELPVAVSNHNVREPGTRREERNMNMLGGPFKPKGPMFTNVSHFRPLSL